MVDHVKYHYANVQHCSKILIHLRTLTYKDMDSCTCKIPFACCEKFVNMYGECAVDGMSWGKRDEFETAINSLSCKERIKAINNWISKLPVVKTESEDTVAVPAEADKDTTVAVSAPEADKDTAVAAAEAAKPRNKRRNKYTPITIPIVFGSSEEEKPEEKKPVKPVTQLKRADKPLCLRGQWCSNRKCTFIHPWSKPNKGLLDFPVLKA